MKKLFITLSAVIMALSLNATDLWKGKKTLNTWDDTLKIEASAFTNVNVGEKIHFDFTATDEGILELKSDGLRVPGSCHAWINASAETYELFITEGMLTQLQASGMEVHGPNKTFTNVDVRAGKDNVVEGAIWTGYLWTDENWNSIDLYTEGLKIDWTKYKEIRIYHNANHGDFFVNVRSNWDKGDGGRISHDGSNETKVDNYVVVDLVTGNAATIMTAEGVDRMIFQGHKTQGDSFNITDIVLVPKDGPTGIDNTNADAKAIKSFRNGMLVIEKNGKLYNALGAELK